jgi:mannose-6-phosphate isomerase-like protein (cupin superfamily)
MVNVINLADKFSKFTERWSPKIVGDVNDMHVKVVKLAGEFVWHRHDAEDELFLIVRGRLLMQLRDGGRELGPGEIIIVPHGVEHCPQALTEEVELVLIEPKGTLNTGTVASDRTVTHPDRI